MAAPPGPIELAGTPRTVVITVIAGTRRRRTTLAISSREPTQLDEVADLVLNLERASAGRAAGVE